MSTETNGSSGTDVRNILRMIRQDMANDARRFDGRPFDGRTVGEYFGNHGAAIAKLAEIVESLLPKEPSVSDERVQEILDDLNGFVVHEYEYETEIANGRVITVPRPVGSDFNLCSAVDWAIHQREVIATGGPDNGRADVELIDGTVLEWEQDKAQWAVTISDDEVAS